ncbi:MULTISPECIES: hypothetical protein, partial [Photorhabdus]|uniref:hypothetical protein n=1 Tax=Photorhabdus TaxID=29487 RepID=UPI00062D0CA9
MQKPLIWEKQSYRISTDNRLLDITAIHQFLTRSSWAGGIDIDTVRCSIEHRLYEGDSQIGFARIVTDFATFGYLFDILPFLKRVSQKG